MFRVCGYRLCICLTRGHFHLHERLYQRAYSFPQEVYIVAHMRLTHQFLKCHADLTGRPAILLTLAFFTIDEKHLLAGFVNRMLFPICL